MNPVAITTPNATPADDDLAEQARPGYGIPSQDPRPAAQMPLEPEESEREGRSVLMGGGVMAGTATGAVIGSVVAGPLGVVIGGTLGAVAGALGGAAAGSLMNPDQASSDTVPADTTLAARTSRTAPAAADRGF